jgi:hypothetical protein
VYLTHRSISHSYNQRDSNKHDTHDETEIILKHQKLSHPLSKILKIKKKYKTIILSGVSDQCEMWNKNYKCVKAK